MVNKRKVNALKAVPIFHQFVGERVKSFQKEQRFTPDPTLGKGYVISDPKLLEKEEDTGFYKMVNSVASCVADTTNKAVVNAILKWAKDDGVTELLLLDEKAVRKMLMRETPKRIDTGGVCRCGACGELVHAGDYYCCRCGQRVREVKHE